MSFKSQNCLKFLNVALRMCTVKYHLRVADSCLLIPMIPPFLDLESLTILCSKPKSDQTLLNEPDSDLRATCFPYTKRHEPLGQFQEGEIFQNINRTPSGIILVIICDQCLHRLQDVASLFSFHVIKAKFYIM